MLVQLSLSGSDRTATFPTKASLLSFFQQRRMTDTFRRHLRDVFVRAHKRSVPAESSSTGSRGRRLGVVPLLGQGIADRRRPYGHQVEAWERLDGLRRARGAEKRRGLLVLPTGAGKTFTMVAWLLEQLAKDPSLRVLWIADQQELVEQAARGFAEHASTMPARTSRTLRVIHGGANASSALGDDQLDIACITRQSLLGKSFDITAQRRLTSFMQRPCVVVIDEAHHAVAPTYRRMLKFVRDRSPSAVIVGLTATPWPSGFGMTALLNETFPERVSDVQVRDLVRDGVLARPVFHTIETGESVSLSSEEVNQIAGRDVPPSVLRRLDRAHRNETIVDAWIGRRSEWGKTLVFACDIEHADNLGIAFEAADVPTTVLHSRSETRRDEVLADFRRAKGPAVLVSVGMLLEGVDVPDARTAFLTRPTTSRILMRQMIGRVLRGEAGGGEALAHVVDLRDRWTDDVDILAPVELPGLPAVATGDEDGQGEHRLPPVRDELTDEPLGEDILRRIERAYEELRVGLPHSSALTSTELVGFYELGHLNVPVFDHAQDRWTALIRSEVADGRLDVRSPVELFDDLPVPRPVRADIWEVVNFCRSQQVEPPLVEVRSTFSVRAIGLEILDAGPMTEAQKASHLRESYERTLARSAFFSFQQFYEAVQQEILALTGVTGNLANPALLTCGGCDRHALVS